MNLGKVFIMGDSYSTYKGHIPSGYLSYYTGERTEEPDLSDVKYTWWWQLIEKTGATLVQNNSWSGSTIGYTGYNNSDCSHSSSFIYRFEQLLCEGFFDNNEIDTVLVFGGTNDSWSGAPLGEETTDNIKERDLYCVLPAIEHYASRLRESVGDKRIVFIGNTEIKKEITECMKHVCKRHRFEYVQLSCIDKISGHPTKLGMAQICDQVFNSLC